MPGVFWVSPCSSLFNLIDFSVSINFFAYGIVSSKSFISSKSNCCNRFGGSYSPNLWEEIFYCLVAIKNSLFPLGAEVSICSVWMGLHLLPMPGATKLYCCLCGDTNFGQTRVDQITQQLGLRSSETGENQDLASVTFQTQEASSAHQLGSEV